MAILQTNFFITFIWCATRFDMCVLLQLWSEFGEWWRVYGIWTGWTGLACASEIVCVCVYIWEWKSNTCGQNRKFIDSSLCLFLCRSLLLAFGRKCLCMLCYKFWLKFWDGVPISVWSRDEFLAFPHFRILKPTFLAIKHSFSSFCVLCMLNQKKQKQPQKPYAISIGMHIFFIFIQFQCACLSSPLPSGPYASCWCTHFFEWLHSRLFSDKSNLPFTQLQYIYIHSSGT